MILIQYKLFGFRTIELVQDKITNGTSFYFRINEKPIFMSGSNWIPATNYYPETEEYYSRLLSAAQVSFQLNNDTPRESLIFHTFNVCIISFY